jgi:hypothetical protein
MDLEQLTEKVKELEAKLQLQNDIEQIKKLQRKYGYHLYGYYFDSRMKDDVINLFSGNPESIETSDHGVYLGKEGIRRFFQGLDEPRQDGKLAVILQLQGVVDVNPDGNTAKGRWTGVMIMNLSIKGKLEPCLGLGTYENEYIKENGEWKFKKLHWNIIFRSTLRNGWVKEPDVVHVPYEEQEVKGELPPTAYHPYTSGYFVPLHWINLKNKE